MNYVMLFKGQNLMAASEQLVIPATEIKAIQNVAELGCKLNLLLEEEQSRTEAAEQEGYKKGYQQGREDGLQQALDDMSARLTELAALVDHRHRELRASVARIAVQIVRKIAAEVGAGEMVISLAETASQELVPSETLVVKVHPRNLEKVAEGLQLPSGATARHKHLVVRADDTLDMYDCVLQAEYGSVIAGLEVQLEKLETVLKAGQEGSDGEAGR